MAYLGPLTHDLSQGHNYPKVQMGLNTTQAYLPGYWQHSAPGGLSLAGS